MAGSFDCRIPTALITIFSNLSQCSAHHCLIRGRCFWPEDSYKRGSYPLLSPWPSQFGHHPLEMHHWTAEYEDILTMTVSAEGRGKTEEKTGPLCGNRKCGLFWKKINKSDMRKNVKMTVRPLLLQAAFQNACTSIQYRHILRNYLKVCKVESNCLFLHVSLCTVFVSKSFLCLLPVTVFPVAAWQCYSTESHSAEAFSACYVALLQVESGLSIRSAAQQPIKWGCIKNNLFKKTVYSEARSQTYGNTDF